MRRCRTWQGNDHCLRPAPSLARFYAATRFAPKREQTLMPQHARLMRLATRAALATALLLALAKAMAW